MNKGIFKFLELIQRSMGASDARLEIGGRDPDAPTQFWKSVPDVGRIVVVFDEPPDDRAAAEAQLTELVRSFHTSLTSHLATLPQPASSELATRRLDVALLDLAERTAAAVVAVADDSSPCLWGRSDAGSERTIDDLEAAVRLKTASTTGELLARALERARPRIRAVSTDTSTHHEADLGWLVRPFAGVYRLVLAFPGEFSELVAEGHALHAMSHIERLVLALPPIDPPPGAKVVRFPNR